MNEKWQKQIVKLKKKKTTDQFIMFCGTMGPYLMKKSKKISNPKDFPSNIGF